MKKLKFSLTVGLVPMLIMINYLKPSNIVFEKYYSNLFYPIISEKLRLITGWVVFPVGDILYLFFEDMSSFKFNSSPFFIFYIYIPSE